MNVQKTSRFAASGVVKIDGEAVKKWATENGLSFSEIGLQIGRSYGYMYYIIKEQGGMMKRNMYELLLRTFDLPDGMFIKAENQVPKPDDVIDGYQVKLDIHPDRLKMSMTYQGETMYDAWSYIKGNTELDLIQAVSYAAHLIYKKAEQAELEGA